MASRRMLHTDIIQSDSFLDMPFSAQMLYVQINQSADDDGFCNSARRLAMNANPFVLVATLAAGLVAAIITLWNTNEDFRNAVTNAWQSIKSTVSSVVNALVNFFYQYRSKRNKYSCFWRERNPCESQKCIYKY